LSAFIGIFIAAFITGLSGALQPGPLLAFTIGNAAKRGPYVGALIALGHGILESTLVILIFIGADAFLRNSDTLLRCVSGIGAAVLAAMGVMMLRGLPKMSLSAIITGSSEATSRIENPVLGGIVVTAVNPTVPIWWLGAGTALIRYYAPNVQSLAFFYAGHLTSDIAWYLMISLIIGYGRNVISDRVYRAFVAICAVALIGLAAFFAYGAVTGHGHTQAPPAPPETSAPASPATR
jgi:threonine/homoserine/homoserine lactone efflux protein